MSALRVVVASHTKPCVSVVQSIITLRLSVEVGTNGMARTSICATHGTFVDVLTIGVVFLISSLSITKGSHAVFAVSTIPAAHEAVAETEV